MIFVTLGTQDKSFVRLLKAIDKAIDDGIIKDEVIVQAGYTKYESDNMKIFDLIDRDEFANYIKKCDVLITHGGVGSIITGLKNNKKVIAIPRLSKYKEHINDHQIQNNEAFSSNGYVLMADLELADLGECFKKIYEGKDGLRPWENKDPLAIVKMIDKFIEENW